MRIIYSFNIKVSAFYFRILSVYISTLFRVLCWISCVHLQVAADLLDEDLLSFLVLALLFVLLALVFVLHHSSLVLLLMQKLLLFIFAQFLCLKMVEGLFMLDVLVEGLFMLNVRYGLEALIVHFLLLFCSLLFLKVFKHIHHFLK